MGEDFLISDEMRSLVGRPSSPWRVELDRSGIRLFARAVGLTDPIYYDVQSARARGYRDIVAPPGFLGTPVYDHNRSSEAGNEFLEFPWVMAELNGGTEIDYFELPCAGDVLDVVRRVESWTQVEGRLGPMLIVKSAKEYRREGTLVAVEHNTDLLVAGGEVK